MLTKTNQQQFLKKLKKIKTHRLYYNQQFQNQSFANKTPLLVNKNKTFILSK